MERQRKNKEVFDCSLLKDVLDSGIINIDSVLDEFMSTKKEQVKKVHPYSITSPASKNGRWQTYYKSVDGKRKIVRAQTEDELLNKLVQLYFRNSYIDKMTFHELYEEWLIIRNPLQTALIRLNVMNSIIKNILKYLF